MTLGSPGSLGLGVLGEPMAPHPIRQSGHPVHVHDLTAAPMERLAAFASNHHPTMIRPLDGRVTSE